MVSEKWDLPSQRYRKGNWGIALVSQGSHERTYTFLSRSVPKQTPWAEAFFCLGKTRAMMLRWDGQKESLLLLWTSLENAKREWNRMEPKYFRKDSRWASCTWNGSLERCWQGKWHLGNLWRNSKLVDTAVVNHLKMWKAAAHERSVFESGCWAQLSYSWCWFI